LVNWMPSKGFICQVVRTWKNYFHLFCLIKCTPRLYLSGCSNLKKLPSSILLN
jgi:hypothetical protein